MTPARTPKRLRRPPDRYHHGDLRGALVEEAVRTIQHQGIEGLTLRAVGERLGVSRTALYRHFSDKSALMAAVARDGFAMLRMASGSAWTSAGGGKPGLEAMGRAYVGFATDHPAHYRVMFSGLVEKPGDPELGQEATGAFEALVGAVAALQRSGDVWGDDPVTLSRYIWSVVHGISMLAIDGHFVRGGLEPVLQLSIERLWTGIHQPS